MEQFKDIITPIIRLVSAIIISCIIIPIGIVYSIGKALLELKLLGVIRYIFSFLYNIIVTLGYLLNHIAIMLDMLWNVSGEFIEDSVTWEEKTTFGFPKITVSASIGKLEEENKLNKTGKWFSNLLNVAFNQKNHAKDAWKWYNTRKKHIQSIERREKRSKRSS